MKLEDYLKADASAVASCPVRAICTAGELCATHDDAGAGALFPAVLEVETGALVWMDMRFEQRVMFVRSGVFACVSNLEGDETPSGLFGAGQALGISELYVPREVASTYYLRALTSGVVCSTPAKAARRRLESMPNARALALVSCALTNISAATYARVLTVSQPLVSDRLLLCFLTMDELLGREGRQLDDVGLTHDELAPLVGTDRTSVTRALHRLEADGICRLGYRRVQLLDGWRIRARALACPAARFHRVKADGGQAPGAGA